jgi:hypothetical protein
VTEFQRRIDTCALVNRFVMPISTTYLPAGASLRISKRKQVTKPEIAGK